MNFFRLRLTAPISLTCLLIAANPALSLAGRNWLFSAKCVVFTDVAGLTATRMPDHAVIISWTTEKERKEDYYEIQRSADGKDWMTIAVALAGTGIENNSYEYIDKNATAASVYYRIRQRDGDNNYSFSVVTTVEGETRAAASIYFADNSISIRLHGQVKEGLDVTILDTDGKNLLQKTYNDAGTIIRISVADLPLGRYTLNIRDAAGLIGTKKIEVR